MKLSPVITIGTLSIPALGLSLIALSECHGDNIPRKRMIKMECAVTVLQAAVARGDCDEMLEAFEVVVISRSDAQRASMDAHMKARFVAASIKATASLQGMRACEQSSPAFAKRLHQLQVAFDLSSAPAAGH